MFAGANPVSAANVFIGDTDPFTPVVYSGTGTITGMVTVTTDGTLAPGGVGPGTLDIAGDLVFDGGPTASTSGR